VTDGTVATAPRRTLSISATARGSEPASRLPFEHVHREAGKTLRARWHEVDAVVLFLAVGAAVRLVAPLLSSKTVDPAVVCVDDAGTYAVSLLGGHARGANELARSVAAMIGAQPVVTTATDITGIVALDMLPDLRAAGDVAGVTAAMLDGQRPALERRMPWPLPRALTDLCSDRGGTGGGGDEGHGDEDVGGVALSARDGARIIVTDAALPPSPRSCALHPPCLVAGIGTSTDADPAEVAALLDEALVRTGLARASLAEVATIDRRRDEPAVRELGLPVRTFTAHELATVTVPNPSATVTQAVGTPSVAEAAALLGAGPGAVLVLAKIKSATATVALARRPGPRGHVALVGLGPGGPAHRTPAAEAAVRHAEIVIGYEPYIDLCADLLAAHHEIVRSPIGAETARAETALRLAAAGHAVAVVCSGDAGIYAMASLVLERAESFGPGARFDIETVPGVTAALATSAALGAPLGHDHAVISLSDLLTPWDEIRARLEAAAAADLVIALYNPRSKARDWQLEAARQILLTHRSPSTPVGIATDVARPEEVVQITTLAELDPGLVGMRSCVIVGSSTTRVVAGRMVTPRGYATRAPSEEQAGPRP
jgi:cobalt-precorrin 5A hydrolase/precorrin-3B C17-methyltransferase